MDEIGAIALAVVNEAAKAQSRYGDFTSTHEALGVLIEEMMELKNAIHRNDMVDVRDESIQVAAVAIRLSEHAANIGRHKPFHSRSNP